jgi:hypothetical protein
MGVTAEVGKVGNGFCGHAEIGCAFGPSHGEDEGENHQGFFVGQSREGNGEERGVEGSKPDPIIAIRDVGFKHVDGAMLRPGVKEVMEKAPEAVAKLHGVWRSKAGGGCVNAVAGKVDDDAWAAVALGDDAERGNL